MTRSQFRDLLAGSVRETVARLMQSSGGIAGYALLTDDDVSTLFYAALTRSIAETTNDQDLLFSPTEWPQAAEETNFDVLSKAIGTLPMASESASKAESAFRLLVSVLAECRVEGIFDRDVFLSVLSTDPGPEAEALEEESIRQLNSLEIVTEWERFVARWS